jgi:hypothetical protein
MFKKSIVTGAYIQSTNAKHIFARGERFIRDGRVWTVTEEFESDNTPMRRCVCEDGTHEVATLKTLNKDAEQGDFSWVQEMLSKTVTPTDHPQQK